MKNETTTNLTENELNLLRRLAENPCADSSPFEDPAWTFNVLKSAADNATFGSLVKKGFSKHGKDGDEYYRLTDLARVALQNSDAQ